jgi:oxalate decarboxylase
MTGMARRTAIGGGAVPSGKGTWETTPTPAFGPAPAPLAGPDLPSFRYPFAGVAPKQFDGGWAKEATVVQFPVSETLAGVLMQLDPGALRELHWHANAADWAYVLEGRCRVTTIDPDDRSETVDFGPGDVWYFPRGHGHSIQGVGDKPCLFLLVFDNGSFSEFGTFSITDWVGHVPAEVLAKNFGVPASTCRPSRSPRAPSPTVTASTPRSRRSSPGAPWPPCQ